MQSEYIEESEFESESAAQGRARPQPNGSMTEQAAEVLESTRTAIRDACKRTTEAVQSGYKRSVDYGTQHPERFGLATFAVGACAGTLLAAAALARQSKTERVAAPVIDAVAQVARAVLAR
jgi:hypothetical protein